VSSLCLGREIAFWVRWAFAAGCHQAAGALMLAACGRFKWVFERLNPAEYIYADVPGQRLTWGVTSPPCTASGLVLEGPAARKFSVPTLLYWGKKDIIVPVKHATGRRRPFKDCTVRIFEKVGHDVHRDELAGFTKAVTGFLG
jgi:pimeloyl-ACP methyl ester carboxylesterase